MKDNKITDLQIWEYLCGNDSELERSKIDLWKNSSEFDYKRFALLSSIYEETYQNENQYDIELELEKNIFFETISSNDKPKKKSTFYYRSAVAVVLVLIFFKTYTIVFDTTVTYSTAIGETKQVTLSDSTKIWLNEATTITFEKQEPRNIRLDGEAFFDVKKDSAHPFTVRTPDSIFIKVLGTSFNINSYMENSFSETTLLTGIIEVNAEQYSLKNFEMKPEDKIRFIRKSRTTQKTRIKKESNVISWLENKIYYNNISLKEMSDDLAQRKNVVFVFQNEEIAQSKFTASFDESSSVQTILEILSLSKTFKYKYDKNKNQWVIY